MADFTEQSISIRYNTDLWGPYRFRFTACTTETGNDGAIPYSSTITSVTVKAYIGNVKESSDLGDFTEITSDIVDPAYTPVIEDGIDVIAKFQYPGADYDGEKVTLIFELTLSTGAKHPFFFQYLRVKGQE